MLLPILLLGTLVLLVVLYFKLYKPYIDCQVLLDDIQSAAVDENEKKLIGDTVVILGGSFAGLTTAIVLAKYYRRVIIVDRTVMVPLETVAKSRQGEQAHAVSYRAILVWDRLLPGFWSELVKVTKANRLSQMMFPATDVKYFYKDGYNLSGHFDMRSRSIITASRGQMETVLRDRIRKDLKNIEIFDGYNVSSNGINIEKVQENGEKVVRVKSVTISKCSQVNDPADALTLDCDLFVNCAGAGSNVLMKNIENEVSPHKKLLTKSKVEVKIRYQTVYFEPKDTSYDNEGKVVLCREDRQVNENRKINDPYYMVYHLLTYPNTKGILIMPFTDNTMLLLLHNYNEKIESLTPERAKDQILEFCQDFPEMKRDTAHVLDLLKDEPKNIAPIYEKNGSEYVHYENLKHVKGFIALGDAVASLNPIYGQGITLSTDAAVFLESMIKQELKKSNKEVFNATFCNKFQEALSKTYLVPWILGSSSDLKFDFSKYSKNLKLQKLVAPLLTWLTDRLFISSHYSAVSSYYFQTVLIMDDGFRKQLLNLRWLFGYVFWRELKIAMCAFAALCVLYAMH